MSGNHFVDGSGTTLQLRGVNVSGLEFVAVGGWDAANPWGAQTGTTTPDWRLIATTWHANVVRIPLNESSWLQQDLGNCIDDTGYRTGTATGASINADPGGNYRSTVQAAVDGATAAGLYVILDLHWTAPAGHCATAQDTFMGSNSVAFWTSVATRFKGYPNVLFEAFNEPYMDAMGGLFPTAGTTWKTVMTGGGTADFFVAGQAQSHVPVTFQMPSWQQVVNAIRATGAANPVLIGSPTWTGDLKQWLSYAPTDTLPAGHSGTWTPQLAAAWHAYPWFGAAFGSAQYTQINNTTNTNHDFTDANAVVAAGVPVLITEFGDQDSAGTTSAPFASMLLPTADAVGMGYVAWTFDAWGNPSNVLITDAAGDPTPGFGVYVKAHYTCRASSASSCP